MMLGGLGPNTVIRPATHDPMAAGGNETCPLPATDVSGGLFCVETNAAS